MYQVTYYDKQGTVRREDMLGATEEIVKRLEDRGCVVSGVKPLHALWLTRPISQKELATILVAIADLLLAGVPLTVAIETGAISLPARSRLRQVLLAVAGRVKEGKQFSEAVAEQRLFDGTTLGMVEAGENNGSLSQTLGVVAIFMGKVAESRSEMIKRMIYPIFLLVVTVVSVLFNGTVMIPKLINSPMFKSSMAGGSSAYMSVMSKLTVIAPSLVGIICIAAAFMVFAKLARSNTIERFLMNVPLLNKVYYYHGFYTSFYSLANLVRSGVRLDTALEIVRDGSSIGVIKNEFARALGKVQDGEHFADGYIYLQPVEKTMLVVAKDIERIEKNLSIIAERFFKEYFEAVKALSPVMYAIAAIITVGLFMIEALAFIKPYSAILSGLGK